MRTVSRSALVLIAILGAFALSVPAVAAQGPPPFTEEWRNAAFALAERNAMFGLFTVQGGMVRGAFVNVTIIEGTGTLVNVSVQKSFGRVEVFPSVTVTPIAPGRAVADGSRFTFESVSVVVSIHNSPIVGLVHTARMADLTVTYNLAAGVSAVLENRSAYVSGGGLRARIALLGSGTIDVSGSAVTAVLQTGTSIAFRVMLSDGEGAAGTLDQAAIQDAFGEGIVASESVLISLGGAILSDEITYLPVSVSVSLVRPGVVEATISSNLPSGKAVILNLDQGIFDGRHGEPLSVALDGTAIPVESSPEATLSAGVPRFHTASSEQGVILEAFVSSFSTHTLLITVPDILPLFPQDALGFAAVGLAVALIAAATVVAVRRGKGRW